MKREAVILIVASLLSIIAVIITAILTQDIDFSPRPTSTTNRLIECKTLQYKGENKINLVFFAPGNKAKDYADFFFGASPFSSNKEIFNVYYIDAYKPTCTLYKDVALLCYSRELLKKASSCPNDFIVVLEEEKTEIRSSSYMNVMSININHPPTVLLHESGHAFANLAEEYVPATLLPEAKNCVKECNDFIYQTDGCFEGCSKETHKRSINEGIMRTLLTKEFGTYNEKIIEEKIKEKTRITNTIAGHAIQKRRDCKTEEYYLIEGSHAEGKITVNKKTREQGCTGTNGAGPYVFDIITTDSLLVRTEEFNPTTIYTDAPDKQKITGRIYENEEEFYLKIPIIKDINIIEVRKDNQPQTKTIIKEDAMPCRI